MNLGTVFPLQDIKEGRIKNQHISRFVHEIVFFSQPGQAIVYETNTHSDIIQYEETYVTIQDVIQYEEDDITTDDDINQYGESCVTIVSIPSIPYYHDVNVGSPVEKHVKISRIL